MDTKWLLGRADESGAVAMDAKWLLGGPEIHSTPQGWLRTIGQVWGGCYGLKMVARQSGRVCGCYWLLCQVDGA